MKLAALTVLILAASLPAAAEKPVNFVPAKDDPIVGDYEGDGKVAQVTCTAEGGYNVNVFKSFDACDAPIETIKIDRAPEGFHRVQRTPPTLGAPPPPGAVVLFDGKNLDAWAKKAGKDWLKEDGPASWKLVDGGAAEVVPGSDCIITHQKFGDCRLHVEFRTLGAPTNSGVFLETRYEVNINETYGEPQAPANGGLDNCTSKLVKPKARPSLPPLAWQTFDIDFKAPRFDVAGKKNDSARMTVLLNGVKIHDDQPLDVPHGAAARLGEAPTGPLMLQEHGMPLQFRNIWIVPVPAQTAASR